MGKQYEVYFEEHGKSRPRLHEERIAKIVGSQITYDLTKFIVNDGYLKDCLCCPI